MTWPEVKNDIITPLPKEFDMNANLGYLTREKNTHYSILFEVRVLFRFSVQIIHAEKKISTRGD